MYLHRLFNADQRGYECIYTTVTIVCYENHVIELWNDSLNIKLYLNIKY